MDKETLLAEAKRRYKVGCKVDQRTAYNGAGGVYEIKNDSVYYNPKDGNVSIGGVGVINRRHSIWATIISSSEPKINFNYLIL